MQCTREGGRERGLAHFLLLNLDEKSARAMVGAAGKVEEPVLACESRFFFLPFPQLSPVVAACVALAAGGACLACTAAACAMAAACCSAVMDRTALCKRDR